MTGEQQRLGLSEALLRGKELSEFAFGHGPHEVPWRRILGAQLDGFAQELFGLCLAVSPAACE